MAETKDIIMGGLALFGGLTIAKDAATMATNRVINNISYVLGSPSVDLTSIGSGRIGIKLPITVLNRNLFSITLDGFFGQILYGQIPIGTVAIPNSFTLVPEEAVGINLFFTVIYAQLIQDVFSAAQTGGASILLNKFYLDGSLFILRTSFNNSIELPIRTSIPILPGL